jgi:hypothetical protein
VVELFPHEFTRTARTWCRRDDLHHHRGGIDPLEQATTTNDDFEHHAFGVEAD